MATTDTKSRLKAFIKSQGLSLTEFCRIIGVSSAYVTSIRKSIQPDKLETIKDKFPNLNIGWLVTGDGDMLLAGDVTGSNNAIGMGAEVNVTESDTIRVLINEMSEQRKESNQHISRLLGIIENLSKE
jgi:transcriptional regulator with XRE-family HTH domain